MNIIPLNNIAMPAKIDSSTDKKLLNIVNDFESIFITEMLSPIFEQVSSQSNSAAMTIYSSLLAGECAKAMANKGGIGLQPLIANFLLQQKGKLNDEK